MEDQPLEHFSVGELAIVLSRYDLGPIESITEFRRGSRKNPKVGIVSRAGKFLLKRRSRHRASDQRLAYSHQLQIYLGAVGFPLPKLVAPTTEDGLALHYGDHVYELFDYVRGHSYEEGSKDTFEAGLTLARFHRAAEGFVVDEPTARGDYHDANPVRTACNAIPGSIASHDSVAGEEAETIVVAEALYNAYEQCCQTVDALGLRDWPAGVIHADWHPGNMLYRNHQVVAVIDYDSIRRSQLMVDVAGGLLHFSMKAGGLVEDWPDEVDQDRAQEFFSGYQQEHPITLQELTSLPNLMVEALIAESVLPVAVTGGFGHYQGYRFVKMVRRKVSWLLTNAEWLVAFLGGNR